MNNLKTRLKNIGPGALVAAAFIGPGTVTSCSTSGANYGYTLLWAMLLSVISVIIMQSMAARLGIVSKMGLGQALREKFHSKPARILLASHTKPVTFPVLYLVFSPRFLHWATRQQKLFLR